MEASPRRAAARHRRSHVLALQRGGVGLVALVGDHREDVDFVVEDALALLVDRQAQAAPDLLALLHLGDGLVEGADLEDVGVVPAFFEGGVGEDEADLLLEGEQPLLVPHDQLEGGLFGLAFGLVAAFGVDRCFLALFGLSSWQSRLLRTSCGFQLCVEGIARFEALELLVKDAADDAVAGGVVGDPVDEEEREHLDRLALPAAPACRMCCSMVLWIWARKISGRDGPIVSSSMQADAVLKLDEVLGGVDLGHRVAGFDAPPGGSWHTGRRRV